VFDEHYHESMKKEWDMPTPLNQIVVHINSYQ